MGSSSPNFRGENEKYFELPPPSHGMILQVSSWDDPPPSQGG